MEKKKTSWTANNILSLFQSGTVSALTPGMLSVLLYTINIKISLSHSLPMDQHTVLYFVLHVGKQCKSTPNCSDALFIMNMQACLSLYMYSLTWSSRAIADRNPFPVASPTQASSPCFPAICPPSPIWVSMTVPSPLFPRPVSAWCDSAMACTSMSPARENAMSSESAGDRAGWTARSSASESVWVAMAWREKRRWGSRLRGWTCLYQS